MEPITTTAIVTALATGAAAAAKDTAITAVKDAYAGLKALIQRKYSGVDVTPVEKKPDSEAKRQSVAEDLANAGAEGDTELQELTRALVAALESHAPEVAPAIGVDLEKVKAAFLGVSSGEPTGTGIKVRESEFSGEINIGSVHVGSSITIGGNIEIEPVNVTSGQSGEGGPQGGAIYRVWYGTNRAPILRGSRVYGFGRRPGQGVHFGVCEVFIPQSHKIGSLGSPWWYRVITGRDDRLRIDSLQPMERSSYWKSIREHLTTITTDKQHALIFLHGYNCSFKGAALRAAQIGADLGHSGPVAFFSWPSRGTLAAYVRDSAAIEASEAAITDYFVDFAQYSGAKRISVIAHSMGNRGLLRAIQRILSQAGTSDEFQLGHIILAAPDITRDLFLQLSHLYTQVSNRTTLYVSDRDRALRASQWLQGERAGLTPPVTVCQGIDTVYVANVDISVLGHSPFAEARPVLADIHSLLTFDAPPERRMGLRESTLESGDRYWVIGA